MFQKPPYRCCYCTLSADSLEDIINHTIESHATNELAICRMTLNHENGKLGYLTKHYGMIPAQLENENPPKHIYVDEDEVSIRESQSFNSPVTKKKSRVVTPPKKSARRTLELGKVICA